MTPAHASIAWLLGLVQLLSISDPVIVLVLKLMIAIMGPTSALAGLLLLLSSRAEDWRQCNVRHCKFSKQHTCVEQTTSSACSAARSSPSGTSAMSTSLGLHFEHCMDKAAG